MGCRKTVFRFALVSLLFALMMPEVGFAAHNATHVGPELPVAAKPNAIPCVPGLPCITPETQANREAVQSYIVDSFGVSLTKSFFGIIAIASVIFIIIGGLQMLVAAGNEETVKKGKMTIMWAIGGLVISLLSTIIVQIISNLELSTR